MKYVKGECRKCGEPLKLYIGDRRPEDVKRQLGEQRTLSCPGSHVELGSPLDYWAVDWDKVLEDGGPPTDGEWLDGLRAKYRTVVDTEGLGRLVDRVEGFAMGACIVRRNGRQEYVDFRAAPSGKRYYFLDPVGARTLGD